MQLKVFDFIKTCLWYIVNFIYSLIDTLLKVIKELNAFDIIDAISNNTTFQKFYTNIFAIAVTLLALVIIWKFVNKILDPEDEITVKMIVIDSIKCMLLIMLSTFMFAQVSNFSITLSNYTGNIFESTDNTKMSSNILAMFIDYNDDYKNSDKFKETKKISELVSNEDFGSKEMYLDKYVTKNKIIFEDDKDYKYQINWIMAIICGGFFLYSLFFSAIMLGRRQIEFLFLFTISPIVFATSVCCKQRRGAVIEELASLALQSAVVMLIVSLTTMVMQQVGATTFFTNSLQDMVVKSLLYLGCATFILTGSQVINRFIGSNVSSASGREQLMSLMGYGKMAGIAGATATAGAIGGGLLALGGGIKGINFAKNSALSTIGATLGTFGSPDVKTGNQSRIQKVASTLGTKMYTSGQRGFNKTKANSKKVRASDAIMSAGATSLNSAVKTVLPRAGYNPSYYRRNGIR